jgi:hypothetical protein
MYGLNKEYFKLDYKFNKLFVNKHLKNYLDDGSIDYYVNDILKQWYHLITRHGTDTYLSIRKEPIDYLYFQQPITKALFDENILLYHKYNKQVHFEQHIYISCIKDLKKDFGKRLKGFEKLKGLYFHLFKAFRFSNDGLNMGRLRRWGYMNRNPWEYDNKLVYHGYNTKWDVPQELYKGNLDSSYYIELFKYNNIK